MADQYLPFINGNFNFNPQIYFQSHSSAISANSSPADGAARAKATATTPPTNGDPDDDDDDDDDEDHDDDDDEDHDDVNPPPTKKRRSKRKNATRRHQDEEVEVEVLTRQLAGLQVDERTTDEAQVVAVRQSRPDDAVPNQKQAPSWPRPHDEPPTTNNPAPRPHHPCLSDRPLTPAHNPFSHPPTVRTTSFPPHAATPLAPPSIFSIPGSEFHRECQHESTSRPQADGSSHSQPFVIPNSHLPTGPTSATSPPQFRSSPPKQRNHHSSPNSTPTLSLRQAKDDLKSHHLLSTLPLGLEGLIRGTATVARAVEAGEMERMHVRVWNTVLKVHLEEMEEVDECDDSHGGRGARPMGGNQQGDAGQGTKHTRTQTAEETWGCTQRGRHGMRWGDNDGGDEYDAGDEDARGKGIRPEEHAAVGRRAQQEQRDRGKGDGARQQSSGAPRPVGKKTVHRFRGPQRAILERLIL